MASFRNFPYHLFQCDARRLGGHYRILVKSGTTEDALRHISKLAGAKWDCNYKCWHLPDNKTYRKLLHLKHEYLTAGMLQSVHYTNHSALRAFVEYLELRAYSHHTIRTYVNEFVQLLTVLKAVPVDSLDVIRLKSYFKYCLQTLQLSENTLHSRMNAVRCYFEQILHKTEIFRDIPRPKKHEILPRVISPVEVKRLFEMTINLKHNTMLKLCYGMGLRVSEIVAIRIADVNSTTMRVFIYRAKGKKDRYVNLPVTLLEQLRLYFLTFRPKEFLFEGQYGGEYSIRSAQKVFEQAMLRAKINVNTGIHGLRHSFATHLMEQGTDIRFIQSLLGHNNIKTTLRYTHVTDVSIQKIISPLDRL
jgi:integrase/recombinase XerD